MGCNGLQCVLVGCSVLRCIARDGGVRLEPKRELQRYDVRCSVLQWVAVGCSGLQWVAVGCSVLHCIARDGGVKLEPTNDLQQLDVCCSAFQCVAVCCIVLREMEVLNLDQNANFNGLMCVAVCCSVLQYVALYCARWRCQI